MWVKGGIWMLILVFFPIKEARYSAFLYPGFIVIEVRCIILLTTLMFFISLISITYLGFLFPPGLFQRYLVELGCRII